MKYFAAFTLLLVLAATCITAGCTSDSEESYYLGDEQSVRITADALRIINSGSEPYAISYSVRSS